MDTIDSERILFVKHYFDADWPTRSLYHMMVNTAIGNDNVISAIMHTMQDLDKCRRVSRPIRGLRVLPVSFLGTLVT